MGILSSIDFVSLFTNVISLMILIINKKYTIREIRFFLIFIISITTFYQFCIFVEWEFFTKYLDPYEDLAGALLPLTWAFLFYSIFQYFSKETIAEKEENLRITMHSISDGIIATNNQGQITFMNPTAELLTECPLSFSLGKNINKIFRVFDYDTNLPIDKEIQLLIDDKKQHHSIKKCILFSNNVKQYIISAKISQIVKNENILGLIIVFSDQTEKFKQEERIKANEQKLSMAISGMRAGVWDWRIEDGKLDVNQRWSEITGFFPKEIENLNIQDWLKLIHPGDIAAYQAKLDEHFQGHNQYFDIKHRLINKSGEIIWVRTRGVVNEYNSKASPARMTGTIIDITENVYAETALKQKVEENELLNKQLIARNSELEDALEEVNRINDALKEAKKEAEQNAFMKGNFLSTLSHEIRAPMNSIMGFTELLQTNEVTEEKKQYYLDIIKKSGNYLLNVISDIIEISKLESGLVTVNIEKVSVKKAIRDVYEMFKADFEENSEVQFIIDIPEDINEDFILTDGTKLQQILVNLVGNAVKFTPQGTITVSFRIESGQVKIIVKDTGIGIEPQYHQAIFERFKQLDAVTKVKKKGSGLGLAICKAYLGLMKGSISLESAIGEGSTFTVTLPYSIDK
ncbi:MAG TPA: ATP-binding protein [Bacteroidales bacterium]|nr:ATP-binding protein [Bacteroidales bacterium]